MSNPNPRQGGGGQVADILKKIDNNEEDKNKLNAFMKKLIPGFTDWTIDTDDAGDYIKYCANNVQHKTNYLGEGVLSLFKICANLIFSNEQRILVIDEQELSLHPQAQKEFAKIISRESANRQVIVCTHSPYFANWSDLKNGAKFVRLNKVNDDKTTVHCLTEESLLNVAKLITEWQRPQLLDTVAKEVLFTNKVLFLEGQEDVGLIKKWIQDNKIDIGFDIFGYGVGGFNKITHFLAFAENLGLEKVAAIFDRGEKESKSFEKAKKDFREQGYFIEQIPAEDIRDKKGKPCSNCQQVTKSKSGVFDTNGNIKEEHKSAFEEIMNGVFNYFKS